MSSCASVTLLFIFATLFKLVSDVGLMSLVHGVIRLTQKESFNKQFRGLEGVGLVCWGQRNVQLGFQRFQGFLLASTGMCVFSQL